MRVFGNELRSSGHLGDEKKISPATLIRYSIVLIVTSVGYLTVPELAVAS